MLFRSVDTEKIVLIDDVGHPIGEAPKLASHHSNTPLHLAFSVHIFNSRGEVLVTQRDSGKKVWPGVWTGSCCGHPAPKEPLEQAVHRRVREELGITITDLRLVLPTYRYRAAYKGIVENEVCPVYIAKSFDEVTLDPSEVMDWRWMAWSNLVADMQRTPDTYSYWSKQQVALLNMFSFPFGATVCMSLKKCTGMYRGISKVT